MKWSIPYVAGGLADQDPMLLRGFDVINRAKARHEEAEAKRRENKMNSRTPSRPGGRRVAGR